MRTILAIICVVCLSSLCAATTTKDLKNTTTVRDNWMSNGLSNFGSADTMQASSNSGAGSFNQKCVMSFANFSDSIGGGLKSIVIDTCILYLKFKSRSVSSAVCIFAKMKPDSENVSTWTNWGTGVTWGSAGLKTAGTTENTSSGSGADFDSTNIVVDGQSVSTSGYQAFDITSLAQKWIDGTRNPLYGIVIANRGGASKTVVIYTSENATSSNQPYLHVVYHDSLPSSHHLVSDIHDTRIGRVNSNTNFWHDTTFSPQSTGGGSPTKDEKYLVNFTHISDSFPSVVIDTAKYFFYVLSKSGAPTVTASRLYKPMYDSLSTWNKWKDSAGSANDSSWGTAGAENTSGTSENRSTSTGVDTRFSDSALFVSGQAVDTGWNSINITTAFKRWRDGLWSQSFGMVIQSSDGSSSMGFTAYTADGPYTYKRPYIYLVTHIASTGEQATTRTMPGQILDRNKDRRY